MRAQCGNARAYDRYLLVLLVLRWFTILYFHCVSFIICIKYTIIINIIIYNIHYTYTHINTCFAYTQNILFFKV